MSPEGRRTPRDSDRLKRRRSTRTGLLGGRPSSELEVPPTAQGRTPLEVLLGASGSGNLSQEGYSHTLEPLQYRRY